MASPLACMLLFRWVLPLVLLGACCFRLNGFSLIYLLCLLIIPLLPNPSRRHAGPGGHTGNFQKAVLGLSVIALVVQVCFQIVLGALPPYGHLFPLCSTYEQILREIGLNRFDHVAALDILRIIVPDVVVFALSLSCVICSRGLIDSSPLRPEEPQRILNVPTNGSPWDNIMPYLIAVMLLVGGITLPSLPCVIYFVTFLVLATMWACHKAIPSQHSCFFKCIRVCLTIYSGCHLVALYLYQFQFFQDVLPPDHLVARLMGFVGIVKTDCSQPQHLIIRDDLQWPQFMLPGTILVLYWLLATETRFCFMNSLMARSTRNYHTLSQVPESHTDEEPPNRVSAEEEPSEVQGTLGSIMMFLMQQSYIAALIIMMAWSITYHSWLTFVLLLWACLIWITPFARWFCMVSSPGLVVYAELLLLAQYVYGLQLNDSELPVRDPSGNFDYSELGLKKWNYPCFHLGAQTLFTWVFWMTMRQHFREKRTKRLEQQARGAIPLTSLAHPFVQAFKEMLTMETVSTTANSVEVSSLGATDDAKALVLWVKRSLAKYWILLCCGAFLLVGLQEEVSVYQIGYMAIFLCILICYQISISTWRLILRPLWWVMVIYSICILLMIYTFQFDNMPMYWHNTTGLSDQWLYNLGLRQHTKASLLLELLTPTAFSIIVVIQLHFFHRPFLAMIDLRNVRPVLASSSTPRRNEGAQTSPDDEIEEVEPEEAESRDVARRDSSPIDVEADLGARPVQRSSLVAALVRVVSFYNKVTVFLWRVGELHMLKLVNLTLICVVLNQVCAINAVIVILLGIAMPSRMLQRALSYCFLIWSSLVILSKMVYQLRFVQADLFQHNCTDQSLPRPTKINHFTNNALWVGFYKTDEISSDIKGYLLIVIVIVLHAVIKHHQKLYRLREGLPDPEPGVLFASVDRSMADENLLPCIKYLFNRFFYHFGWEVCMMMIVINMAVRCDVTSVIYALWLGAFLVLGRLNCAVVWPVYVGFLAVLLPLQYLLALGWPPALCLAYPWTSTLDPNLAHWLYLTDVNQPPDQKLLFCDFFQLLFACCQEIVFSQERYRRLHNARERQTVNGSGRRGPRGKNPTPDFMWNITWLDSTKVFIFQHLYWVTLAVVYITVQSTISIFNFGFILWCFVFLWHGQALYLQPMGKLLRLWKIFVGYNYFTLLAKVCLQLVSCVWVDYVRSKSDCWTLQLLSLYCLRSGGYKNTEENSSGGSDCVEPDDTGLTMDCACFVFLILQYRIFTSDYFRHVVRDHREQADMAKRGAELVNEHVKAQLEAVKREDKMKMDRIKKTVNKLKEKQKTLPSGEVREPQSHYEAIYSGDYYMYESDSDRESETESSTASPSRSSSPSGGRESPQGGGQEVARASSRGEPAGEGRRDSASSGEGDYVSVRAPEEMDDTQDSRFSTTIKKWFSWIYYYFAMIVDKVIEILNDISKDYREIADQLKKEKKEKRREMIRRARAGAGSTRRPEQSKADHTRPFEDSDDSWSADVDDVDASNWKHSHMRLTRFTVAFAYALLAHTDIICYMLMILNHMVYASLLSMPLPFLLFLWGMLSIPRPTKFFWITVITYTQVVIVIKYLFKFQFIPIMDCADDGMEKTGPLCAPKIWGIERDSHTSAYDLLLLLALFFHRYSLKVHGLWQDKAAADIDDHHPTSPNLSAGERRAGSMTLEDGTVSLPSASVEGFQDAEAGKPSRSSEDQADCCTGLFKQVARFVERIYDPEVGSGAVDVYAVMFACQFIIFVIIMFSWSAFSTPEPKPQALFMQIIEQNMVPKTFLYMLLTQFLLIIIDRSLYLRKFVIAKLVYLVFLVIAFHIFMFIVVPYLTQRPFIENIPAIFMYIFKCMYFGLSAYQVRCGYPTRILGNFLTKNYTLTSGVLFQGFQAIPFLLELRSILDWVCTDTTLTLYHWLKMEDIYANIYVLKCYRESEKTWFQARGQKYWTYSKWGLGGVLVALLVIVIWFPLLFMSYINSVYTQNVPQDATFTLSVGGYQPLFRVSAQEQFLKQLSNTDIDELIVKSNDQQVKEFLQDYKVKGTIVKVKIPGNSSSIWTISPPSREIMMTDLQSENNITMRFTYEFTREPKTALAQETISGVSPVQLGPAIRHILADMLNGSYTGSVTVDGLFPQFVHVPASGSATPVLELYNASYVTCRLKLRSDRQGVDWWELTQSQVAHVFSDEDNAMEMITFNDLVPPLHFSFFTSHGIIGLYVGFVWLIGKFVRLFFTSISYRIMFDEMPNVDKVLKLCLDVFMVRESKEFELEEDLFAKLMFLYRSPETLIKWTKYKRS